MENINKMNETDFIHYIVTTICDYAKANNYGVTDTVKTMGENLVCLTEIADFDNWKDKLEETEEWLSQTPNVTFRN